MNIIYIAIQGLSLQKLKAQSAVYLRRLCFGFAVLTGLFGIAGIGSAAPSGTPSVTTSGVQTIASWGIVTAFLLSVMIYELFFNQFFTHYLNDLFPLQEGKANLPIITAAGSLSFIASGLFLKITLSVMPLDAVLGIGLFFYLAFQLILPLIAKWYEGTTRPSSSQPRSPIQTPSAAPSAPFPEQAPNPQTLPAPPSGFSAFGRAFCLLAFLCILGKYWLDYQYSRAITDLFHGEKELAGFIGLFTASTDALVLIGQMTIAGPVLAAVPLPIVAGFLPAIVLLAGFFPLITGSAVGVLITQFLFTLTAKTFFNPVLGLLPAVLPAAPRLRLMGAMGMSASAGAMIAGVSLLFVQRLLGIQAAFVLLTVIFAGMLFLIGPIRAGYRRELLSALDGIDVHARLEAMTPLMHLSIDDRVPRVERLLNASEEDVRLAAIPLAAALPAATAVQLLSPRLADSESSKVRTAAVRALAALGSTAITPIIAKTLSDPDVEPRMKANLIEGLGEFAGGATFLPEVVPFLEARDHRLRANAAVTIIRLGNRRDELETALSTLWDMLGESTAAPRAAAVSALGRLQHEVFLPELGTILQSDPDPRVIFLAVQALAGIPLQAAADLLAGVHPSDGRFSPEVVEEAKRAREAIERMSLDSMVHLFDTLTAEERTALAGPLSHVGDKARREAIFTALALPDSQARAALSRFLLDLEDRTLLEFFRKPEYPNLLDTFPPDTLLDVRLLSPLFQVLLERGARLMYDSSIKSLWKRLFFVAACRERQAREAPEYSLCELTQAIEEEFALFAHLTAQRCSSPGDALEAMKKGISGDRFALSLALEVLRPQLAGECDLASLVSAFLSCHSGQDSFVTAAKAHGAGDAEKLSTEKLLAVLRTLERKRSP
ncbi:MAG: HEAT repeat domain-containing protein [Candidatus Ozemobacteraceae bacterium]